MLGILSLDTAFPRILGDVGNPDSYPFEVSIAIVGGADSTHIVVDGLPSEDIIERFESAAVELEAAGAQAIISTCGFLATVQDRVARKVRVPVLLSALSLVPLIRSTNPGRIGILTASSKALGNLALTSAGIRQDDVEIEGYQDEPLFAGTFLVPYADQPSSFDRDAMQALVVAGAKRLRARAPDITALVLECGNLPPYSEAIRAATDLRVYSLVDTAGMLIAGNDRPAHQGAD